MVTECSVPPRMLRSVQQTLRGKPSGMTTRELAYALGIPITHMYQYVNRLHQLGLLEPTGLASKLYWKGPQPKLWRWAGRAAREGPPPSKPRSVPEKRQVRG